MKSLNSLKFLLLTFILGTLLVVLFSGFIDNAQQRWAFIALYTWSGAAFIMYKTFQITKRKTDGSLKK